MTFHAMTTYTDQVYEFVGSWFGGTMGWVLGAGLVIVLAFGLLSWVRR